MVSPGLAAKRRFSEDYLQSAHGAALLCNAAYRAVRVFPSRPLRFALLPERLGFNVDTIPLSSYRRASFYTMRTDALDRFGTRLEKRFTADQIEAMMRDAGLERIAFAPSMPYWCAVGIKN